MSLSGNWTTILGSPKLESQFISNIVNEVQSAGFNGVQLDAEPYYNCSFNSNQFTTFVGNLHSALTSVSKSYVLEATFSIYETCSINVVGIAPYVSRLLFMFDPSLSMMNSYANKVGTSKMAAGYELFSSDPNFYVPTTRNLKTLHKDGYSVFFWNIGAPPMQSVYGELTAAGY
jgi:hypothetical protein